MGRARIPRGTAGVVTTIPVDEKKAAIPEEDRGSVKAAQWRASTRVRLMNDRMVVLTRFRRTKAAAEQALRLAVRDALDDSTAMGVKEASTVTLAQMADRWLESVQADDKFAERTKMVYAGSVKRYIPPTLMLAQKPIGEIGVGELEDYLTSVSKKHGRGTGKTLRSVMTGIYSYAVRRGECDRNIARETAHYRLRGKNLRPDRDHQRAFTPAEILRLLETLKDPAYSRAGSDIADLVQLLLGTGLRIGEALAIHWEDVQLTQPAGIRVVSTVGRVTGKGLIRPPRTKSRTSQRPVPIAWAVVEILKSRPKEHPQVFPAKQGGYRDPSNVNKQVRRLLDECGFGWAVPHTFRRTLLTQLGDAGVPLRQVADLAGHASPAMTARYYLGRQGPNKETVAVLNRLDTAWHVD